MPNRLAQENSLYLRQHAQNPVNWYPWGEEALANATEQDKPLLISIGYSACHWCHVMAHESFEDDYIARLMNTHFVCVKVDREEHPEVDAIYMDAVQMMNGHGGWPLNVFCLPDGRPFAGGTYFPPDERRGHNIVPWPQLLMRVADFYRRQRADLEANAIAILGNMEAANLPRGIDGSGLQAAQILQAAQQLVDAHDGEYGGFGGAPKFPPASSIDFLLALRGSATVELKAKDLAVDLDSVINRTLTAMAHGGIYDQIGGGFSRYSVDRFWLIPHFEKMLYDNALLIECYSKASQRYPKPVYARVVEESIAWLNREMRLPGAGYAAALDADTNGKEGLTYLWTPAEVAAILGSERATAFCSSYGISTEGNFEHSGKSQPALLEPDPQTRDAMAADRQQLLQVRSQRPQPGRDDKCLTAWNALLARALAHAAFSFDRSEWLQDAIHIADWIWNCMRMDERRLRKVAYDGHPSGNALLDDYAFSAEAFLKIAAVIDLFQPGESDKWIRRAATLGESVLQHFGDPKAVGFFVTSDDHEVLVHRKKDWFDNAIPSGNSSMVHVFAALELLTSNPRYAKELQRLETAAAGLIKVSAAAASYALSGWVQRNIGIATLSFSAAVDPANLRLALAAQPYRNAFVRFNPQQSHAYQLCIGTQCLAPSDAFDSIREALFGAGTNSAP